MESFVSFRSLDLIMALRFELLLTSGRALEKTPGALEPCSWVASEVPAP